MTSEFQSSPLSNSDARLESAWLVACFRKGDERAAETLFDRYFDRLTALVRARLSARLQSRVDADDVAQSTYRSFFVRASAGQFEITSSGDLWRLLARMALHKLSHQIVRHKAAKRAVSVEERLSDANDLTSPEPSPDEAAAVADELEFVMRQLSETERRALELRLQGELLENIAAQLGQSERTVRRTLARVREIMLKQLPDTEPATRSPSGNSSSAQRFNAVATLNYADFDLKQHIGDGLTGKVYRAWWKSRAREVAVKYLRREHQSYPERVERFCEEAVLVADLRHPNIATVYGLGKALHGGYFIALEWIDGCDLQVVLNRSRTDSRPLVVADIVRWMTDAARAVQHAHESGLIHCDLKPSNLLLASDGRVVLTDFGFARRLAVHAKRSTDGGTLAFMAPEQLEGSSGKIGPQADIYSWGAVLYVLLTGETPRTNCRLDTLVATCRSRCASGLLQMAPGFDIEQLCRICISCLNPDPMTRPATMLKVLAMLDQLQEKA